MRMRFPMLLLGLAVAAAAAGCTTPSPGDPSPTSSRTSAPTSSSEDDLPSNGAPAVEDPLDVTKFIENPCKVLTPQQLQDFELPAGAASEGDFGPKCDWRQPQAAGGALNFTILTKDEDGLSSLYKDHENGYIKYFEELSPIEGYPAVLWDTAEENRPIGTCAISVGVSNKLSFTAIVNLSAASMGQKDPCETATAVATMATKNMKGD